MLSNPFKLASPGFLSGDRRVKSEVEDKSIDALLMGKKKNKSMLEDLVEEEGLEESEEMQKIQSVQDEKIKPMQGSWNWNPNNMTLSWSIKRATGSPDRYSLAFKQEGIEFDKEVGSEEDKLGDFDTEDSEEVPVILTGTK